MGTAKGGYDGRVACLPAAAHKRGVTAVMPEESQTRPATSVEIIYDGDCPICSHLALKTRLEERCELRLSNAREHPALVRELAARGMDLNEGMVVRVDEDTYYGPEALLQLHSLATSWGAAGLFRPLFRRPGTASRVYPLFVAVRKTLLRLLRRGPIDTGD